MSAYILFLGTGGGRIIPLTQERTSGGIIVNSGNYQIHIDPGPGALLMARSLKVDVSKNNILLVSNSNATHSNEINLVIDAMTNFGKYKRGTLITNNRVSEKVLGDEQKKRIDKFFALKPEERVKMEKLMIKATTANKSSTGFKISTEDFILGYTGDAKYSKDLVKAHENSDILTLNVLNPMNKKSKSNLSSDDAVKMIEKVRPKLALITHFGVDMLKADPVYEAREIAKATKTQVIAAHDGLKIDPLSYSAELRQKTLNLY